MKKNDIKIGDTVRVKERTLCPDQEEISIGGWQGRVTEITDDKDGDVIICIEWDSKTLENMPESFIVHGEEELLINELMYLGIGEVELMESGTGKNETTHTEKPGINPGKRNKKEKLGRNDPCPCGSGKKYKKCCMSKEKLIFPSSLHHNP